MCMCKITKVIMMHRESWFNMKWGTWTTPSGGAAEEFGPIRVPEHNPER